MEAKFDRKEYMKKYMKDKRKEEKEQIVTDDFKELFRYCYPWILTENYEAEDWERELEYFTKLIEKANERKDYIINSINKFAFSEVKNLDENDIIELIKNEYLRLSPSGGLQLVNIHNYKK